MDSYRRPWGRYLENRRRQCVFFATTNNYAFLKDETGDRRYYPIDVNMKNATKDIENDLTPEYVSQLWAEAVYLYNSGASVYIKDKSIIELAERKQRKHFDESPLQTDIQDFLEMPILKDWYDTKLDTRTHYVQDYRNGQKVNGAYKRDRVCIKEIICELYGCNMNQTVDRKLSIEIARTLTALGWHKTGKVERVNPYGIAKMYYCK